jgi:putative ABC transport system permease protein
MDIFKLNLKLSFRQLAGNKLYTFVNVLGLTIGFAAFISIFFWRQSELQTDRFHENAENIFLLTVQTDSTTDHVRARYGGVAEKVGMKYPEVQSYTEIADVDVYLKNPDNAVEIKSQAITVHPGFFEMFDFKLIDYMGDSLMSEPNTIVLTQSLARKLFNDKNPLGEIITLQYSLIEPYKIVGIIEDVPDNSSFEFECIVPENEDGNYWGRMSFSFVELHDNTDIDQFAQKIKAESRSIYSNTRTKTLVRPFPFTDIYFNSDFAWFHHGDFQQVEILGIVALLILLVSIINYINLATAQAKNRAKEIGIKKITGASRSGIFTQFYLESAFMVFVSLMLALLVVELMKPQLYFIAGTGFAIDYLSADFLMKMSLGLLVIFFFAGLYPAIHLSSFNPIRSLKGIVFTSKNIFRHTAVILQYSVCIILVVATLGLQKQLNFIQSKDLGFDKESVVRFEFFNDEKRLNRKEERDGYMAKLNLVFNELNNNSSIEVVGKSRFPIYTATQDCWGFDGDPDKKVAMYVGGAGKSFSKLYDIKLLEGRFFGDPHPTDTTRKSSMSGIVINKTASEQLFSGDAIGKRFTMSSWGEREVIGVVEDFNYQHLSMPIKPLVLYGSSMEATPVVRFAKGRLKEGMEFVQNLHKEVDPGVPFSYEFLDQELGDLYEKDQAITRLMSALSTIALIIASLGLFALSAYMVDRRVKEIGIRKVNGANIANIFTMLSKDFLKWVVYAAVVAMPLSWYFMHRWLQNYAYRTELSWWIFAAAGMATLLVSWLTISYHSGKASLTNPVDVLRNE